MSDTIIELAHLDVYQGSTQVFNNLCLSVDRGQHTVILGPNGSGKTSLLKLLSRALYPVVKPRSHIRIFGQENINLWDLRQKVGFVSPEFQNQFETLSTGEDVVLSAYFGSMGLYPHHTASTEQHIIVTSTMESLGISHLKDTPFLKLSSGQQRRLLLARALVHKPELVIFDEPTNNLDIQGTVQLLEDMRQLAKQGITLILVTHHLHEIVPEINRVIGLSHGKVLFDGNKEDTLSSENLSALFNTPLDISQYEGYYRWTPRCI